MSYTWKILGITSFIRCYCLTNGILNNGFNIIIYGCFVLIKKWGLWGNEWIPLTTFNSLYPNKS